jgi:hypothetical protein
MIFGNKVFIFLQPVEIFKSSDVKTKSPGRKVPVSISLWGKSKEAKKGFPFVIQYFGWRKMLFA